MIPIQIDEIINLLDILDIEEQNLLLEHVHSTISLNIRSDEFVMLVDGVRNNQAILPVSHILEGHVTIRRVKCQQNTFSALTCQLDKKIIHKNLSELLIEQTIEIDPHNISPYFFFYKPETLPIDPEEIISDDPNSCDTRKTKTFSTPMEVEKIRSANYILPDGSKFSYQRFDVTAPMALFLYKLYRPLYGVFDPNDHDTVKSVDILIEFPEIETVRPIVIYKSETYKSRSNNFPFLGHGLKNLKLPNILNTGIIEPKLTPYIFNIAKGQITSTHYNNFYSFSSEQIKRNDLWLEVSPALNFLEKWQAYKTITEKPLHVQVFLQDKCGGKTLVDIHAQVTLPTLSLGR